MANYDCMAGDSLQPCPKCKNEYLAIRTDIYKDQREFVYCDCCGCITERDVWNRVAPFSQINQELAGVLSLPG